MRTKDDLREAILAAKQAKGLTWDEVGEKLGRSAVGAATLCWGYGAATDEEADALIELFDLPEESRATAQAAPMRTPAQPWPPTDPFIYRIYESLMLYGPAWKDVAHEMFGDGIISAIDCSFDLQKVTEDGVDRANFVFNGKWLTYKRF